MVSITEMSSGSSFGDIRYQMKGGPGYPSTLTATLRSVLKKRRRWKKKRKNDGKR